MNKAVVFDLDGTLLDTIPDILFNLNLMLKKFGHKTIDFDRTKEIIGYGAKELVKEAINDPVTDEQLQSRLDFYNNSYTANPAVYTQIFSQIPKVLIELKKRGYKLAILTNKPQFTTDKVYNKYLQDFEFDLVVGQSDKVKCKPDKTALLDILSRLNVLPENAYMVGDGETDVLTAINANVLGIACLWGYRGKSDLEKFGGKIFVNNPIDLLSVIE